MGGGGGACDFSSLVSYDESMAPSMTLATCKSYVSTATRMKFKHTQMTYPEFTGEVHRWVRSRHFVLLNLKAFFFLVSKILMSTENIRNVY